MKIEDRYKVRSIADENIIIMQGKGTADMTKVVSLNATSVWLFDRLRGREFTAEEAAAMLAEEYGIDNETAMRDAGAWIDKLAECGIITR